MIDYIFLIRGPTVQSRVRKVTIQAPRLGLALDKILALFPSQFVNTKFARRMDLMNAKKAAAKRSKEIRDKAVYIIVDEKTGECDLSGAPLRGVYTAFKNGGEIALSPDAPVSKVEPITKGKKLAPKASAKENASTPIQGAKNKQSMATEKKSQPKAAATKAAAKPAKPSGIGKATTLILSGAQWAKVDKLTEKEGSIREMVAKAMIKTYSL